MSFEAVSQYDRWPMQNDWSDVLVGGDTIASRLWVATPADGITLAGIDQPICFIEGFVFGRQYQVLEHIETTAGAKAARGFGFVCGDLS